MRDFRYGIRMLARNPFFAAAAILCAALGTGVTTAIFSVVNAVLLRPLPYARAGRLVRVFSEFPKEVSGASQGGFKHFWISPPEYFELKRDLGSFDAVEAWVNGTSNIAGQDEPLRVTASFVTGGLLDTRGVQPMIGRFLTPADDDPNAPTNAVLSYDLWQRAFARDPRILGRDIRLNGAACTVVGVMPGGFNFPPGIQNPSELWTPVGLDPANPGPWGRHFLSVLARLRPGVALAQAQSEVTRYAVHPAARSRAPNIALIRWSIRWC